MDYVEFSINYAIESIILLRPIDWCGAGILAIVMAGIAIYLIRKKCIRWGQAVALVLLSVYIFLVFCSTVFARPNIGGHAYQLVPFWSYREIVTHGSRDLLVENLLNIVMLMPVGFLLPVLSQKIKVKHTFLVALAISYAIEFSQLLFGGGLFELVDDPFHNIVGAMIGYGIYHGIMLRRRKRNMA